MINHKYSASPADGKEILRILESSAAKGNIELVYTRRPDAYESYMKESEDVSIFVSKDEDKLIGTCAELVRDVYIDNQICRSAYICGLKKDANYDGRVGFGIGFVRSLFREDIDYYYCSVVSDNKDAQKMFEKSKRIISMKPIASYKTYIINPKVKLKTAKNSYIFRQVTKDDIDNLINFLNNEGMKKELFPVFKSLDQFSNLNYTNFYILLDGEKIVAAGALWNQTSYKQYVVKKYRRLMKLGRFINPILSAFKYIKLPKENEFLNFPILSFFLSEDDNDEYYLVFLSKIKDIIAKSYDMFVIGLPKEHFARNIFDKLPSINFETKLYEITFPWSKKDTKKINPSNIYLECGLL